MPLKPAEPPPAPASVFFPAPLINSRRNKKMDEIKDWIADLLNRQESFFLDYRSGINYYEQGKRDGYMKGLEE